MEKKYRALLINIAALFMLSCGAATDDDSITDTGSDTGSGAGSDTGSDTGSGAGSDTGSDTAARAVDDTDTAIDTDTGPNTDSQTGTDAHVAVGCDQENKCLPWQKCDPCGASSCPECDDCIAACVAIETPYTFLDVPDELAIPPDDENRCVIASSSREWGSAQGFFVDFILRSFDANSGVVSEVTSRSVDFQDEVRNLHWRISNSGRLLAYGGKGEGEWRNFRHDYTLDEQGNITRFEFTYGIWDSLLTPSTGRIHLDYGYAHTYENGLLQESVYTDGNYEQTETITYAHDTDGRCTKVTYTDDAPDYQSSVETLTYNAAGRLAQTERVTQYEDTELNNKVVTQYTYDEKGRLTLRAQDGGGHWGATADGRPDIVMFALYFSDGGRLIQYLDFTNDLPNDEVDYDGTQTVVDRRFEVWSPACDDIDARIPKRSDVSCALMREWDK